MPRQPNLSKSAFIRGRQCLKSLFLAKKHPEFQEPVSPEQQAVFDRGHEVGELATGLFPGGILASYDLPAGFSQSINRTTELIRKGHPVIYEAGFRYGNLHCFVDILVKNEKGWAFYEVKSSTETKEVYIDDAAFQYYIMDHLGLHVTSTHIIHINNQYIRAGELDIHSLFHIESIQDEVIARQSRIHELLLEEVSILNRPVMPDIPIGPHCTDPYPCDFKPYCWSSVPDYSVFDVSRLRQDLKFSLYEKGILLPRDIPDDIPLNDVQRIQVMADRNGEGVINRPALKEFLQSLHYPLYFLDFETFNPAVPIYDQSRPYQQIVFQYSLHIQDNPGTEPLHREFLAEPGTDPRLQLMDRLQNDIGPDGDIVVYNKGFEQGRLNEIGRDFPEFSGLVESLTARLTDLMEPFRQKSVYLPAMHGSYSIKKVLPALVPRFSYEGMAISNGGDASLAFTRLLDGPPAAEAGLIRRNLLDYCHLDTLAMVEILGRLYELASSG